MRKNTKKSQKNGIRYCVCQFFFVSLQPIFVRVRLARPYIPIIIGIEN